MMLPVGASGAREDHGERRLLLKIRRLSAAVLVAVAVLALDHLGYLQPFNTLISEIRMAQAQRPASGDIVHLAIDRKSLDRIGVWPWPREVHARIIEKLIEHDAADIALDIDFSSASTPRADRALARALEAAGGSVVLPAFVQASSAAPGDQAVTLSMPLPMFREHVWLASTNVVADRDGVVRRFASRFEVDGAEVPALPALLAGRASDMGAQVEINFTLAAASVPAFPVIDLLEGAIGARELAGRSVVVGAHAIELGDHFTVPVHGIISGPLLQILAAETIAQGIIPRTVDSRAVLLGAVLLILAGLSSSGLPLHKEVAGGAIFGGALEVASFLLQIRHAVILPTAGAHLVLVGVAFVLAFDELGLRQWLLRAARTAASNAQLVLTQIIHDSSDAIIVVGMDASVLEINRSAQHLFGLSADGGLPPALPEAVADEAQRSMAALRAGHYRPADPLEIGIEVDGAERWIEYTITPSRLKCVNRRDGDEKFVACITARDITEKRHHELHLEYLARFDEPTGAMRRSELLRRLEKAGAAARSTGAVFAVRLHRFDAVTSMLGREIGDLILAQSVRRLADIPRVSAVARLGAATFAVTSTGAADAREAEGTACAISGCLTQPFLVNGTTARIGARIGFAVAAPYDQPSELLRQAEAALDDAREADSESPRLFHPASLARQERARAIEHELWGSLERQEIRLVYQPQVKLSDCRVIGAEALVRWRHPVLGDVAPSEFIPIAEGNGFIRKLGPWILEKATSDAAAWPSDLSVAVNVSQAQFAERDFTAALEKTLADAGLAPHRLQLEIMEATFLRPTPDFLVTLAGIRALGTSLALDDFGTGYSSLGYLVHFPLDKIKIDRLFVQRIATERVNQSMLKSIRSLSSELGMQLLCEGIEREDELAFLHGIGCDHGQGYLFGRPTSEGEFLAMVVAASRPSSSGSPERSLLRRQG